MGCSVRGGTLNDVTGDVCSFLRDLLLLVQVATDQANQKEELHENDLNGRRREKAGQEHKALYVRYVFPVPDKRYEVDCRKRGYRGERQGNPWPEMGILTSNDARFPTQLRQTPRNDQDASQHTFDAYNRIRSEVSPTAVDEIREHEQGGNGAISVSARLRASTDAYDTSACAAPFPKRPTTAQAIVDIRMATHKPFGHRSTSRAI